MTELGSDLALTIIRVVAGLVVAAHGAQKTFGLFGGPGMQRWHGAVASMGFAQPRAMGTVAAFVELFGGLAFAVGLYTPIAAALLAIDMIVAVFKVHWPKGFFVTKGGYEFAFVLLVAFAAVGMSAPTRYSLDAALSLAGDAIWFVAVLVVAGLVTIGSLMVGAPAAQPTAPR